MIDFDDEIRRFTPSVEVEDAEDAIYNKDIPDIPEVIGRIIDELSQEAK